jgi:hypothetical protein
MRPRTESGETGDVGEARKRAATLPPVSRARPPTVQPIGLPPVPPGATLPAGSGIPDGYRGHERSGGHERSDAHERPAHDRSGAHAAPGYGRPLAIDSIPPVPTASASLPIVEPVVDQPPTRNSGPPQQVDLENAITNPPPLRRTMLPPLATRLPAIISGSGGGIEDDMRVTAPRKPVVPRADSEDDPAITGEKMPIHNVRAMTPMIDDAGRTEPSMPKLDFPLKPPPASNPNIELPSSSPFDEAFEDVDAGATLQGDPLRKAVDLASRLDAAGERDEWSAETPVMAPSKAELRALLGVPDVTRKQSIDEIDRLHRAVSEMPSDPEILPPPAIPEGPRPRALPTTVEVNPDDIEAAIEVAPPSSRRTALGISKPKKPTK